VHVDTSVLGADEAAMHIVKTVTKRGVLQGHDQMNPR